MEMILDAIDKFNQRLKEQGNQSPYTLDDNQDKIGDNYALYIARKNGTPKDDFPGLNLNTNVKKVNYERFSLALYSSAFVKKEGASPPG